MKAFGKQLLPPDLDPIQRDLLLVLAVGLAIGAVIVSLGFVMFH